MAWGLGCGVWGGGGGACGELGVLLGVGVADGAVRVHSGGGGSPQEVEKEEQLPGQNSVGDYMCLRVCVWGGGMLLVRGEGWEVGIAAGGCKNGRQSR